MFRTEDKDLVGIPGMFGAAHWHGVSRIIRTHWYHLVIRVNEAGRITEYTRMIEGERKLQHMLVSQSDQEEISDVLVVTPTWMNKSDRWNMDRVSKVSLGTDKLGSEVCVIQVESGDVYHNSHTPNFNSNLLTNLIPIFLGGMIRPA